MADGRARRERSAAAEPPGGVTRRDFIKGGALLGGTLLAGGGAPALAAPAGAIFASRRPDAPYARANPENLLYSVCLNCNTGCGIKCKVEEGVLTKIDGNPYSPWTMTPHIPYTARLSDAAVLDGAICPKGQAGLQIAYDPYRIRRVLKRAGRRGENRWISIPFEQAIQEIVEGGRLFAHVPGEENRHVEGLREIRALRDPDKARAMAADVQRLWNKEITVEDFKARHRDALATLIDPDHPDLGPKNNQLVFMWGRLKGGRSDLIARFVKSAFGSVNAHGHTTVCQGSLYFTSKAMSEQYQDGKWTGGKKFYWQADTGHSEFLIFVGASPFEGNYGPPLRTQKITEGLVSGRLKYAVVDPRFSNTAAKAWRWLPARPGTEGALAMAMIRWVLENGRYDARYLSCANRAAAESAGEPTWTNATWLVKVGPDGTPGKFLRASEIGLTREDRFVALAGGQPVAVDPYSREQPVFGDLFVDTEIGGHRVKTPLQLLREASQEHTIEEWAEICGVQAQTIVEVAREFTAHGKRAAADIHRGASQHTNGFYNVASWMALNLLVGNPDWRGGLIKATTYNAAGGRPEQPFPIGRMMPGGLQAFGISLIRHEVDYRKTTLFDGYPARRPWYPLASDIYQEIIPSAGDGYPYPIKALFLYMGAPTYALPAGHAGIEILSDVGRIPLFVACDITVGATSMYADYIFPDLSWLERWEFHGSHPSVAPKVQPVRQPVIAPIPETVRVFGEEMPISLEAMLLAIAEKMGLPGFGPDGFGPGQPFTHPDHLYLKMVANVAAEGAPDGAVPEADDEELRIFEAARRHLPASVYDRRRWEQSVGPQWWRRCVYVLNRGGRFQGYREAYDGDKVRNRYGTLINLYQEKTVSYVDALTGKPYRGYAGYVPLADSLGRPLDDRAAGYDLHLITYREIFHTKSRTNTAYWLLALRPENDILIHPDDARRLGLAEGDRVRILSATNPDGLWPLGAAGSRPMEGRLRVTQGIRPGVVAFSLGFGHWANGAAPLVVDGERIPPDERRGRGIHANAAMRLDPYLKNTCLSDTTGGSAVFYDTLVRLRKV